MSDSRIPLVHLVGSCSLSSSEEVFREVGKRIGGDVARIPDGETGDRGTPFPLQKPLHEAIKNSSGLVQKRKIELAGIVFHLYGPAAGFSSDTIQLGSLGFAAAAKSSFVDFKRLRDRDDIPPAVKMQVSLPTPFMIGFCFTAPECLPDLWPAFERAMGHELADIARSIPHEDLAIQFDISPEVIAILEHQVPEVAKLVSREQILQGAARITDAVPRDIAVGWHLCYGDAGPSTNEVETNHPVEPRDLRILVDFANDLCAATKRAVDWVHMPVPRSRDDEAYFLPLKDLRLKPGMQLFLGLVHRYDGLDGARRRISAARKFYPSFGVGTECGMGRRAPADIPSLLDLHHDIAGLLRTARAD